MKYWVARDNTSNKNRYLWIFRDEPEFVKAFEEWQGNGGFKMPTVCLDDFPQLSKISPGQKAEVELTINIKG